MYNQHRLKEKPFPATRTKQRARATRKRNKKVSKCPKTQKNVRQPSKSKCLETTNESSTLFLDTPPSTPQQNCDQNEYDDDYEDIIGLITSHNTSQHSCSREDVTDINMDVGLKLNLLYAFDFLIVKTFIAG